MTTRQELETEAAELYPNAPGRMFNGEPFPRFEQQAHVRAKTITAEQLLMTAKWDFELHEPRLAVWEHAHLIVQTRYLDIARRRYNAAGFYVEEPAP